MQLIDIKNWGWVEKRIQQHRQSLVGAGLLAKAPDQSTSSSTDPSPSRASPLPQGVVVSAR
ncbi:hypothetical protein EGM97_15685 [Pseudomonas sp. AF32]|nr:hypothetical protein [Pseudomonas sp. AF32]